MTVNWKGTSRINGLSQIVVFFFLASFASAGTWTKLSNPISSYVSGPILLTDGSVIVQGTGGPPFL